MMYPWFTDGSGPSWTQGVGMVVSLAALAAFIALFVWSLRHADGGPTTSVTPRQILDERFARGEIDAEEYQSRLRTLSGDLSDTRPRG